MVIATPAVPSTEGDTICYSADGGYVLNPPDPGS
jgi:hypothetical protein